jgi:hypothetical protein
MAASVELSKDLEPRRPNFRQADRWALIPSLTERDLRLAFQASRGLIQGGEPRRFALPVSLRTDFDAVCMRALAKKSKNGAQTRRLLAVARFFRCRPDA